MVERQHFIIVSMERNILGRWGGYGEGFKPWLIRSIRQQDYRPYNSCGNGAAMRVEPVGWAFDTIDDILAKAKENAECTHNHPEGIKGAQATALAIMMARHGCDKNEIRSEIEKRFEYDLQFTYEQIRPTYNLHMGSNLSRQRPTGHCCFSRWRRL